MASLRSRRLESIFGAPVDQLTPENIRSLIDNQIAEDFDLDFKAELYARSDSAKRDLAGDVSALANTAGGVIVIGVAEDEQARAVAAEGVLISDAERIRMLQVVAASIAPMPQIDILPVPLVVEDFDETGTGEEAADGVEPTAQGFFIIAVPRSTRAPHAVVVNEGFRYPRRNGPTTRYLSESEIAAAYRDRLAGDEAQTRRIDDIEREASRRLERQSEPWVMVSLVPGLAGEFDISWRAQRDFQNQMQGRSSYEVIHFGSRFERTTVGRKRLIADGGFQDAKARYVSAEYHSDGSGSYALDLWDIRTSNRSGLPSTVTIQLASDEGVVVSVLTALLRLADHARNRTGASGDALIRAQILPAQRQDHRLEIGHTRGFGGSRGSIALEDEVAVAETTASLDDLATPGPALVSVAARLTDELAQMFGFPEMGQLTREGEIRIRYWSNDVQDRIRRWAEEHGITVTEQTLEES